MVSLILRIATRMMVGLILVFSAYLFFRGHNAPGGGFSAALVASTGFALFAIAEGAGPLRQAIRTDPLNLVAFGLLLAIGSGLLAIVNGGVFLTGLWWPADAAGGKPIMGTPLLFDAGVYFVVLGTVLTLILQLEEY
jgi:multisubunit Na+/H+ antiporter MnhB subunit